ncbi:outer membrane protein assembly factor BamD [Candidatus Pelagibacter bacterium nBUS_29]|uniref:outer membrane protein assembly factor BamD n=1 Tax=Candidatus Pelagibacter bacterium nBUS_29 TaxID=3374190 RepID=UPI003EBDB881
MIYRNLFNIFLITLLCFSCSKKNIEKSTIKEVNLESQMIEAYKEGLRELDAGDALFAAKKFNEAEILFPQSEYAPKSALMAAYSYYSQNYYGDAIAELIRFLRVYPNHKDLVYAEYLLGLCYYEQIVDEKKDLQSIINAKKTFESLVSKHPDTEFATDAMFKINLIDEILAAKEMYLGRYYVDRKKWIPALNRFRIVVDDYETTIYVEEAIHRLVEIYYTIGIETEAKKYANLLGYNYQSSEWYEKSFSVFNKKYKKNIIKDIEKENNSIIKKFKSLLN